MNKPTYYVTNIRDFLDTEDLLPEELPGPARRLTLSLGRIIEECSPLSSGKEIEMDLKCRRRPGRKPCPGKIKGMKEKHTDAILWRCSHCDAGGEIYNWRGSLWDRQGGGAC
jgi:hypothetical protein